MVKVKTPKPTPVVEDPAVQAQRLAAEKAATDAENSTVSALMSKKTRLKARVFGAPAGAGSNAAAASSGGTAASFAGSSPTYNGSPFNPATFNVGSIWKGGMY